MLIQVCSIKDPVTIKVHGKAIAGYKISFTSRVVAGEAILLTAAVNHPQNLIGSSFSVELSCKRLDGIVHARLGRVNGIYALSDAETYHVCGVVAQVDSDGVASISVVPNSIFFLINIPPSMHLEPGDKVEFDMHGLELWDEKF
nr:hypothetical protein [Candidatus Sigynarchaeota archaeon]